MSRDRIRWIRWLSARGVPPGHVMRVLDCTADDVASALDDRHGHQVWIVGPAVMALMRRMRAEGRPYRAIGEASGLPAHAARAILRGGGWRPKVPASPPGSRLPSGPSWRRVRRLSALGYTTDQVAELLCLRRDQVAEFLARLRADGRLSRVPTRRAWGWARGEDYRDDGAPEPAAASVDDGPEEEPPGEAIAPGPRGSWEAMRSSGQRSGNASMTDEQAERARQMRARGVPRDDVAREFGVSRSTITRLTRGETYRGAEAQPPEPEGLPPQIAAAEAPGERWEQPPGWRSRHAASEWRDD